MLAVCASHSPLMLTDIEHTDADRQRGFHAAIEASRAAIAAYDPELVVVFGPDHFNGLFFDLMPSFCIGTQAQSTADWGLEPAPLNVPADVALRAIRAVRDAGLDVAFSHRLKVDHGITIPLHKLAGGLARYPVLPVVIDCAADPRPSFARCRSLGDAVGRFLATTGKRVVIVGSGGLSHDPPTPRLAESPAHLTERLIVRNTPSADDLRQRETRVLAAARALVAGGGPCRPPSVDFDRRFLDRFVAQDLAAFDAYTDEYVDRDGGFGGHEVRCWVAALAAMRAAGAVDAKVTWYDIVPEWITGMGVVEIRHRDDARLQSLARRERVPAEP